MLKVCLLFVIINVYLTSSFVHKPCVLREYKDGFVCVCNTTYCDSVENIKLDKNGPALLISSTKSGLRFVPTPKTFIEAQSDRSTSDKVESTEAPSSRSLLNEIESAFKEKVYSVVRVERDVDQIQAKARAPGYVTVNRNTKYQKIVGFGAALTGTVSHILDSLPKELQDTIYKIYYSQSYGNAYNLLRVTIGGSDFDMVPWAYNESPRNDLRLTNFTVLDLRDLNRIRQIKYLRELTENNDIRIFGAAWSSPPWMKTNNDWTGYGSLKSEYYQTWADYHLKFLQLWEKEGCPLWSISTGNEPLNGEIGWLFVRFMSLGWTAKNQGKWVAENLGPTIKNSSVSYVKIFGGDDQRYTFPWWFNQMNSGNSMATSYLTGFFMHWYWDEFMPPFVLDRTHETFPEKILLNSESCLGDKPWETHGPTLGSWDRGEKYATYILQNLEHWGSGWVDWNMVLDEKGGPSYVNNFVDAAVIVNTTSKAEIYKQPIFYVMGHYAKFIQKDAVRIEVNAGNCNIKTIGFENPDGTTAIVFLNKSNRKVSCGFVDAARGQIQIDLPEKSIHTLIYA